MNLLPEVCLLKLKFFVIIYTVSKTKWLFIYFIAYLNKMITLALLPSKPCRQGQL